MRSTLAPALGLLVLIGLGLASPSRESRAVAPASAAGEFAGIYDLYLGGIRGGEIVLSASLERLSYRAEATGRTAGVIGKLYKAGFDAKTRGRVTARGYVPERFSAKTHTPSKNLTLEIGYAGGAPLKVSAEPPFDPKPWQLEPSEQTGAFDPLSAALAGLALQPRELLCNRSVEIFDGRRRYAIDLGAAEPAENGSLRCPAKYRRVAGFKPKMLAKEPFPFAVWFEEGQGGLWHVVRAMGETPVGVAAITLRR